jgi:hypothetical protein
VLETPELEHVLDVPLAELVRFAPAVLTDERLGRIDAALADAAGESAC